MFEKFGEYMFFLLCAPLKKAKKTVNQFYIFFKVAGKLFDQCKLDLFRLREEVRYSLAATRCCRFTDRTGIWPGWLAKRWRTTAPACP